MTDMPRSPSPGSVARSADDAMAFLPAPGESDVELASFKKVMEEEARKIMVERGGPAQYLNAMSAEEKADFAKFLWKTFPEQDCHLYHHEQKIPSVTDADIGSSTPTIVHIAALGFSPDCSLKPPPGKEVFTALVDQYLQDGFVTSCEPLLVVQTREAASYAGMPQFWTAPSGPALATFSLGYIKGMARVVSLLTIVHRAWKMGLNLEEKHPVMFKSLLTIHVHHMEMVSKVDEALKLMKLSARGNIRKKTNVIQTVVIVKNLHKYGLADFTVFTRKWNQQSARGDQIVGKRAMSLKLMFVAPQDPRSA